MLSLSEKKSLIKLVLIIFSVKQHDAAGEKEEEKKNPQYQRLHAAIMTKKTILN